MPLYIWTHWQLQPLAMSMICDNGYVNALRQWLIQWFVTMARIMGTMMVAELVSEVMTELMSDLAMHTILTYLHVWISMYQKFTMCSKDDRLPSSHDFWLD